MRTDDNLGILLSDVAETGLVRDGRFEATDFAHGNLNRSLCLAASEKYVAIANKNPAISCVVTLPHLTSAVRRDVGVVAVENPAEAFYRIHNHLYSTGEIGIHLSSTIDPSARIHPSAVIERGCHISSDVIIDAGAIIKKGTQLSEGVFVGAGSLVGVEGHFYKRFSSRLVRIEHSGGVLVGAGSQILAGAIIQRSLHPDFTIVGNETVLGPGVKIGHGVQIGDGCTIAGGTNVAGYTRIENSVWIGPSCTIGNLIEIGEGARIEMGSVVAKSVKPQERLVGWYASSHLRSLRAQAKILSGK